MEAGASEPADGIRPIGHDEVSLTLQHEVPSKSVGAARMSAINWPALRGDMEQAEELLGHLRSDSQKLDTYYEFDTRACPDQPWQAHHHSGGRRACHAVARS